MEEFGEEDIDCIQQTDIEDWIFEFPVKPRTRGNYIQTMSTIFNLIGSNSPPLAAGFFIYAEKRKWCRENPAKDISRPILDDKPPGILTPEQTAAILQTVLDHMPEHVPGFAISLFAGLRVSELCDLDWSEVLLDRRMIEVKAAKAKTRRRRLVNICDTLATWLAPYAEYQGPVFYREEGGKKEFLGSNRFGKDLRWLVGTDRESTKEHQPLPAIVSPWPHNAIRHSFGSYHLGLTRDEYKTSSEMGNTPAVVFKHYREIVFPDAVEKYWKIMPPWGAKSEVPVTDAT
jgi:integrase